MDNNVAQKTQMEQAMPILLVMLQHKARIQRNSITRESLLFDKNKSPLQVLDDDLVKWMVEIEMVQRTFYFDCLAFYRLAPAAEAMLEDRLASREVTAFRRHQRTERAI